ncbi:MAG: DMT family transporter [Bacteroidota bacterium]|nr:DMT family transporter [Bacteroidota bacterium]MDP4211898.1 DMT family transporter [Bacteroidota bacterium]MDP4248513.1 DMT family transporter [Bacteroidota bacterium]
MKKAFIQLHIAVFLAGFTGIMGRLITLNESLLVWYRLLITCTVLWILSGFRKKTASPERSQMIKAAGIGIILIIHWVSFYAGIKYSTVSTALVCFSAIGFFTAILEPILLRKRMDKIELLLGLLVILGIGIIFHFDPRYKTGIIISLCSAFFASIFPVLNWKLLQTMNVESATRYQLSGGFLFLTLLIPFYLHFFPSRIYPSVNDWFWLLVLALICTVLAYSLMMTAQQKIPAFTLNLTYNLEPIYGIALAFLIYREDKSVSRGFYYGLALIVAAIALQMVRLWKISGKNNQAALVEI